MAKVRIVLLKPVEIVRDEPKAKPGSVVIMSAGEAEKLTKSGLAALYGDFRPEMIPGYKTEEQKALEDATAKAEASAKADADAKAKADADAKAKADADAKAKADADAKAKADADAKNAQKGDDKKDDKK